MTQRIPTSVLVLGGALLFFLMPLAARADDDAIQLPEETKAGRILEDRDMARSLIRYGLQKRKPEAILIGVEVLHENPVKPARDTPESEVAAEADKQQLQEWVRRATAMRPEDELLIGLAKRVTNTLKEKTRGLAAGPQRWTVEIEAGGYFELDPSLVYNAHEKAVLSAFAQDNTILRVTVRRADQAREYTTAVGQGHVRANWNAGIHTTGWIVRVHNMIGPGTKTVRIETN